MVGRIARLSLCLGALAASTQSAQLAAQDFEWDGRMEEGQTLIVRGISGDLSATLARGNTAEVVGTKSGRESDFDDVRIEVFEERNATIICVIYASRGGNSDCNDHGTRDDDDRGRRSIRVSVDFEILVPSGVTFEGRTVSGDVDALGLRSDVDAATVSGDIDVSTTGVARARTVSGSVDVDMGSLDWRELDFATVSGDITVTVPGDLDSEIEFKSLSGDFDSEFGITIEHQRDRFIGSELNGVIGEGRRHMSFKTVSGDVELRKSSRVIR